MISILEASRFRSYLLAIGWTLGILIACSIPGEDLPELGFDLFQYDKLIHFTFFLGFGWLWLKALPARLTNRFVWIGLTGLIYSIATELYQGILPWERSPDPMDALANILGLLAALLIHERASLTG